MTTQKVYREAKGKQVAGVSFTAFIKNGGIFFLTNIKVYKDGMIDCWEQVDFEEFKKKVRKGWVVTNLPENADVHVSDLCQIKATDVTNFVDPEEFIKDVADALNALNGYPTSSETCLSAYRNYVAQRTEAARNQLKEAYEAVPEHNRRFILGDQDVKDFPIRMIIYGEQEMENWSHRIASKQLGLEPLPTIKVPPVKSVAPDNRRKPWWRLWDRK